MKFEVRLTFRAQADIEEAVAFIAGDSSRNAHRWLVSLIDLVNSLESMPMRFPGIAESTELGRPWRG
ncbi:MAG: type II toxin-antitoxin system RelE/ParE family toxin [Fimbriimonadaceae bacterium]